MKQIGIIGSGGFGGLEILKRMKAEHPGIEFIHIPASMEDLNPGFDLPIDKLKEFLIQDEMTNRAKAELLGLIAVSGLMGPGPLQRPRPEPDEFREPVKPVIPKGLKEFNIGGKKVYALNYKNAVRKAGKGDKQ